MSNRGQTPAITLLEQELRRRRWSREYTVAELARTARSMGERTFALSVRQLDRWLSGQVRNPRGVACRVAEKRFGKPIEVLLGPVEPDLNPPAAPPALPMAASVTEFVTAAADTAREHAALSAASVVDVLSLEQLYAEVRRLARAYASTPPLPLLAGLARTRDLVYTLLDRTRRPADIRDLYLVAGQVCGLAATTSFDLGYVDAAEDQARAAWTYGQLSGHDTLRAWARSVQATIAFWDGRPSEGLDYVASGMQYAHGLAAVRLHAIAARAWAMLTGGEAHAQACLRAAAEARDRDDGRDEMATSIGGEFGFSPARQALCAGAVYVALRQGTLATHYASEALRLYEAAPPDQQRWGVRYGACMDLATARALQGDLDAAADVLRPAMDLDEPRRTARLTQRLFALRAIAAAPRYRSTPVAKGLVRDVDDWAARSLTGGVAQLALPPGR